MLSSINPLGERAKGNRFGLTAAAFVVGATLGGLALGAAAGVVGAIPAGLLDDRVRVAAVGVAALVGLVVDVASRRGLISIPSWRRQVDEEWLDEFRGTVYGFGFGAQLGFGVVTIVTSAITWVVVIAAALQFSFLASVGVGATFGLARGLGIVGVARVGDAGALRHHLRRFSARESGAERVTLATLAAVAAVTIGGALIA
jgi:hypothetical protein